MELKRVRSATWGRNLLVSSALILSASVAMAGQHKLSRDLVGKTGNGGNLDVIVQFGHRPSTVDDNLVASHGGVMKRHLGKFQGAVYTVSAARLVELSNDPGVAYVSPDRKLRGTGTPSTTAVIDYHKETINAPAAWALGLDGTGVGVAIIDSGMAANSDLNASNVVYSQDFTGSNSTVDQYGHGTHVAGIIAGTGAASSLSKDFYTFKGIADNVSIVNLRVLDQNGAGTDSEVIAAIQEAIELKSTYNIKIINLSLGRPVYESYTLDPLCQAVEQAWQAGITVVTAAGNYGRDNIASTNGYGTIIAPGNDPYVITVGAMNTEGTPDRTDDVPASYSSKGPSIFDQVVKPDIVAPGNSIVSLYTPGDTLDAESDGSEIPASLYVTNGTGAASSTYYILSGTSMATPMVTGAAALVLEQNPNMTPDQVKATLMVSAFKGLRQSSTAVDATTGQTYTEQADLFTVGAGYLDVQAALANTALVPAFLGSAASPTATVGSDGDVVLIQTGNSVLGMGVGGGADCIVNCVIVWGSGASTSDGPGNPVIVWGSSAVSGDGPGNPVIVWGSGSLTSDVIVWGSDSASSDGSGPGNPVIVWGSSALTSDGACIIDCVIVWGSGTPNKITDLK
jgi:serine protease AprX